MTCHQHLAEQGKQQLEARMRHHQQQMDGAGEGGELTPTLLLDVFDMVLLLDPQSNCCHTGRLQLTVLRLGVLAHYHFKSNLLLCGRHYCSHKPTSRRYGASKQMKDHSWVRPIIFCKINETQELPRPLQCCLVSINTNSGLCFLF